MIKIMPYSFSFPVSFWSNGVSRDALFDSGIFVRFRVLRIFKIQKMMNFFNLGSHPANLLFRFLLEITVLVVVVVWSWRSIDGWLGFVLAFVFPFILALIWGIFAVPDDPSRSGKAPVPISGLLRLVLELMIFSFAVWCLNALGVPYLSVAFTLLVLLHYVISLDRVRWLIKKNPAL